MGASRTADSSPASSLSSSPASSSTMLNDRCRSGSGIGSVDSGVPTRSATPDSATAAEHFPADSRGSADDGVQQPTDEQQQHQHQQRQQRLQQQQQQQQQQQ